MHKPKVKEVNYILNKVSDKEPGTNTPKYCMLIGAGCSYESGLPLGGDVIALLQLEVFINEKCARPKELTLQKDWKEYLAKLRKFITDEKLELAFSNYIKEVEMQVASEADIKFGDYLKRLPYSLWPKEKRQKEDKEEMLKLWELQKEKVYSDLMYGAWFELYNDKASERQQYIEQLMDNTDAQAGYIFMANIVKTDYIRTVFTTNFDDLVYDALMRIAGTRGRVFAHQELSGYIDFRKPKPNIVKLHGDYLFQDLRNTISEIDVQGNRMHGKLQDAITQFNLIVCGYNGADQSIMQILEDVKISNPGNPFELIWCSPRPFEDLHWRVKELLKNYSNSWFINIGFDELMAKMEAHLSLPIITLQEQAKRLEEKIGNDRDRYLNKAKKEKKLDDSDVDLLKMKSDISNERDIYKRIEKCQQFLAKVPNDFGIWNTLGMLQRRLALSTNYKFKPEMLRSAAKSYEQAVMLKYNHSWQNVAKTWSLIAIAEQTKESHDQAVEMIERAYNSGDEGTINSIGRIYYDWATKSKSEYKEALYRRAIIKFETAKNANSQIDLLLLGVTWSALGQIIKGTEAIQAFDKAEKIYLKLIAENGENGLAYTNLSADLLHRYHLENNKDLKSDLLKSAFNAAQKATDLGEASAFYNLACAYSLMGKKQLAFTWLEKAFSDERNLKSHSRNHVEKDPDFEMIRSEKNFIDLLNKYRPKKEAGAEFPIGELI